jgi:O-antigen/teichoic acid export membrane protein
LLRSLPLSLRDLLLEVAHTSGTKIYSMLIAIATVSMTARWLGPEGRGQLVVATTWIGLLATFGHLSLGQVAIHRASKNPGSNWLPSVLGSLLFLAAASSVVIWLVLGIAFIYTGGAVFSGLTGNIILLTCAAFPLFLWEYNGSALLISQGRIGLYNLYLVIGRTLALALLVVIVYWGGYGVAGGLIATIVGQGAIVAGIFYGLKSVTLQRPTFARSDVLEMLKGGAKLHLNAVGVIVFGTVDVLLLNRYRGPEEAAFYQIAVQLVAVMLVVPQSVAMVLYGRIAGSGADAVWPQHKRIVKLTLAAMTVGGAITWILAPILVNIVAGGAFTPAIEIFRWLLLALIGMTFSTTMAPQWIGRGLFIQASGITIAVGVVSALANFALIPSYGAKGAAWAAIGTYLIGAVFNLGMMSYCDRKMIRVVKI